MNNATRKEITALIERLESAQSTIRDTDYTGMTSSQALGILVDIESEIEEVQGQISGLQSDEQDKYDNMSEGLQGSERGEAIQAAAEALSYAYDECDEVVRALEFPNQILVEIKQGKKEDGPVDEEGLTEIVDGVVNAIDEVIEYLNEAAQ